MSRLSFSRSTSKSKQNGDTSEVDELLGKRSKRYTHQALRKITTLDKIPTWHDVTQCPSMINLACSAGGRGRECYNRMISIWSGDIYSLDVDAIVNQVKLTIPGSTPTCKVDSQLHAAAGPKLSSDCKQIEFSCLSEAKITPGYNLPAKSVIHVMTPSGENPHVLKNCYINCLDLAQAQGAKSIAFPAISTGPNGYPVGAATQVALSAVSEWVKRCWYSMERIVFVSKSLENEAAFDQFLPIYFPPSLCPTTRGSTPCIQPQTRTPPGARLRK